jgi:hypothetical protein
MSERAFLFAYMGAGFAREFNGSYMKWGVIGKKSEFRYCASKYCNDRYMS